MKLLRKAAAALCSAALAVSLMVPAGVSAAEGDNMAIFHWDDYLAEEPLFVPVDGVESISNALGAFAYDGKGSVLAYPEPGDTGKVIVGWTRTEGSSEIYSLYNGASGQVDLYPVFADAVSLDTIQLTADTAVLPEVGKDVVNNVTSSVSVPADAPYKVSSAYISTADSVFKDNSFYYLTVNIVSQDGKAFSFTYKDGTQLVYDVKGASVNGEKANVQWESTPGENSLIVYFPIALGTPETVKLNLNGNGYFPDKSIDIPRNSGYAYMHLSDIDGDQYPIGDGDHRFDVWCSDPELTTAFGGIRYSYFDKDTDLYARWCDVIHEINLTVETPLCGDDVLLTDEAGNTLEQINITSRLGNILREVELVPGAKGLIPAGSHYTNEPNITCDVPGVEAEATWIKSDKDPSAMDIDTEVNLFYGTLYGEQDYMFVINAHRKDGAPIFAEDMVINVNNVKAGSRMVLRASKAGLVSSLTTISKGGTTFTVVGVITADHVWGAGVTTLAAGCEEKGIMTFTCRQNDATKTEDIDPFGHKWEDWKVVKPATATEDGLEMRVCDNNGEHTETRIIPKTGEAAPAPAPAPSEQSPAPTGSAPVLPAAAAAGAVLTAVMIVCKKKQ